MKAAFDLTDRMKVPPLELSKFLLDEDHPILESKRKDLLAEAHPGPAAGTDHLWLDRHDAIIKGKGWDWPTLQAATRHMYANPWYMRMPQRKREVLQHSLHRKNIGDRVHRACTVDVSQNMGRVPMGLDGICQTVTPKMDNWVIDRERCMMGVEALALQGFPVDWGLSLPESVRPSDIIFKDLAGNAFTATVFTAVYLSMWATMPPRKSQEVEHAVEDIRRFMA